jgi:hypothetical protein
MKKLLFSLLFLPSAVFCCEPPKDNGRYESTDMTATTPSGSVSSSAASTSTDSYYGGFDAYEGTGLQSVDTGWNGLSESNNNPYDN